MKEEDFRRIFREEIDNTFTMYGFDPKNPQEMQKNVSYMRDMRKGCETIKSHAVKAVVTATIPTALYIFWQAIKGASGK